MKPIYWIIAVGAGIALACAWQFAGQVGAAPEAVASADTHSRDPAAPPVAVAQPLADEARATPEQSTRWLADVDSTDATTRAAAIQGLMRVPRAQALPVLKRVVLGGEPTVDRPLALNSLRELALDQGDADGGIRQVMREVIYHGDDEQFAASAQEALEVVEESEQKLPR